MGAWLKLLKRFWNSYLYDMHKDESLRSSSARFGRSRFNKLQYGPQSHHDHGQRLAGGASMRRLASKVTFGS